MPLQSRLISYFDGDTELEGYFAFDSSSETPEPGVLISHMWGGRVEFVCEVADRLAALGFNSMALDMYGKGVFGKNAEENMALMTPFLEDRMLLQRRMLLALDTLKAQPEVDAGKVAAIGYCFGGLCVLDLARTGANIAGVVSLHGLFTPPENTEGNPIRAKILALHGNDDPMVPPEQVQSLQQELTSAGADWQLHTYGGTMHAFTLPEANDEAAGTVYNPDSDHRSWQSLLNFFDEIFV